MKQIRKTKIICTLGPPTDKEGVLRRLIEAGEGAGRGYFFPRLPQGGRGGGGGGRRERSPRRC